jgi:hypothetical protein
VTETTPESSDLVCWQCGAPADPDCAYVKVLNAPSKASLDGRGYPIVKGRRRDLVRVSIPRCDRCQARNWTTVVLSVLLFMGGGFVASWLDPTSKWISPVGAFAGLGMMVFLTMLYERHARIRPIGSHPALSSLRAAGWQEPD